MRTLIATPLVLAITFLVGCGGNSNNGNNGGTTPLLTSGNWSLIAKSAAAPGTTVYLGGSLTQNGSSISGTLHVDESACYATSDSVPVTGTIKGTNLTITSGNIAGQVITASLVGSGKAVSGTYSISGGCASGDHGSVTGTWIPNISGTWNGNILTGSTAVAVKASVTQSSTASANGTYSVVGQMSYTNSPCSTGATVSTGFIVGDMVYIGAASDDLDGGTGDLEYVGYLDVPSTATKMSGTYWVNSGLCAGDSKTLHLAKQ